jgi:hypothetical protein
LASKSLGIGAVVPDSVDVTWSTQSRASTWYL